MCYLSAVTVAIQGRTLAGCTRFLGSGDVEDTGKNNLKIVTIFDIC
jgi:hypothetical protein